jgi:hypothetical protein
VRVWCASVVAQLPAIVQAGKVESVVVVGYYEAAIGSTEAASAGRRIANGITKNIGYCYICGKVTFQALVASSRLRCTNRLATIPASNKNHIGNAISVCEMTSGGDSSAPMTKQPTMT